MHDLRSYDLSQIPSLLSELGQPAYRAKQLLKWVYVDGASSYDECTNLPKSLRSQLADIAPLQPLAVVDRQQSLDGTRKYVFEYHDGVRVEAVGMPSRKTTKDGQAAHLSVCLSTQAGCAMGCAFCATGEEGLTRNLSSGEIISQIVAVQQDFGQKASHVVAMGQGEPFHNYDSVIEALRFINSPSGLRVGARHITLSTCGLIKGIERFSHEPEQFTLAISLHAARQEVRDALMPRCRSVRLPDLKDALQRYTQATGRRVSLEYLMIHGKNDSDADLKALLRFCYELLCHVNLIPLNAVENSPFKPSPCSLQRRWAETLLAHGTETTIRNSRGQDIDGACGQLKNKLKS